MVFPLYLLTLLQLQSYLVPCISARIFIIPKLQNIYWIIFFGKLFSLCREHLPNCYFIRSSPSVHYRGLREEVFGEHFSHALPTEKIFYLLRSIPSTLILLRFISFSIPLLCLTLRTSFSLLIYAYSSTYSCTVHAAMHSHRAAMHSSCSLAQFLHSPHAAMHSPCTVNAQPCTVHVSWYINPYVTSLFFS